MEFKDILKENNFFMELYDYTRKIYYNQVSETKLIERRFKKRLNRKVELKEPIKYNDKLQWLKLYWRDPLATKCADKYEVRQFIKETIGSKYLNDVIAVYDSVDEINIEELPEKFVLKGTHGSGFNIICTDKSKIDWDHEVKKMRRWSKKNYYLQNREWVYKDIKPRIICERFLTQNDGDELRDYRFFCFNGEPKFVTVDFSINDKKNTRRNLYDLQWKLMDAEISYPKELNIKVSKPEKFEEMVELSKKIARYFPHARIDFYYINERIIFGEITFFHQSGMGKITPEEFEITMGNWLELPKKTKNR